MPGSTCNRGHRERSEAWPSATSSSSSRGFTGAVATFSKCTRAATGAGSPDRPNPLGLHPVTVRAMFGNRLRVGPIEAIDGTPVVDIKPVIGRSER